MSIQDSWTRSCMSTKLGGQLISFEVDPIPDVDPGLLFNFSSLTLRDRAFCDIFYHMSYTGWWIFTKLREIIYTSKRALSNFGIVLDPNHSGYLDSGSITRYGLKSRMTLVCIKDYLRCWMTARKLMSPSRLLINFEHVFKRSFVIFSPVLKHSLKLNRAREGSEGDKSAHRNRSCETSTDHLSIHWWQFVERTMWRMSNRRRWSMYDRC